MRQSLGRGGQAGVPPFYSDNTKAAYQRLLTEPVEFPDAVASAAARDFIRALLQAPPHPPTFTFQRPSGRRAGGPASIPSLAGV